LSAKRRSAFRQAGLQVDRALFCLQDHPGTGLLLGLPTLVLLVALFLPAFLLLRHWEFDTFGGYLVYSVALPTLAFMILSLGPLPVAVFAHGLASGRKLSAAECCRRCLRRPGRLARLAAGLFGRYLLWNLFFALPALVYWPRTCLATHVVLFEEHKRIFWRSGKLLKVEAREISLLLYLYLGIAAILAELLALPRLLTHTRVLDAEVLHRLRDKLPLFELTAGCVVLVLLAVCWMLSVTFLYLEIRTEREGEELRDAIERTRARLA
jgi:hypothetical protein